MQSSLLVTTLYTEVLLNKVKIAAVIFQIVVENTQIFIGEKHETTKQIFFTPVIS